MKLSNIVIGFVITVLSYQSLAFVEGGRILQVFFRENPNAGKSISKRGNIEYCGIIVKTNIDKSTLTAAKALPDLKVGIDLSGPDCTNSYNWIENDAMAQGSLPLVQWESRDLQSFKTTNPSKATSWEQKTEWTDDDQVAVLQDLFGADVKWKKPGPDFRLQPMTAIQATIAEVVPNVDLGLGNRKFCVVFTKSNRGSKKALVMRQEICREKNLMVAKGRDVEFSLADLSFIRNFDFLKILRGMDSSYTYQFVENEALPLLR